MRILVLGAGQMANPIVWYLANHTDAEITIADINKDVSDALAASHGGEQSSSIRLDVSKDDALLGLKEKPDAIVGCVSYDYNVQLTKQAIQLGAHFCDLGGNIWVVDKQITFDEQARDAGVSVIPDCGLAPGMANWLAVQATKELDELESLRIYVGGLPQDPEPPLDYQLVFAARGLINEYLEPARHISGGLMIETPSLTELEQMDFPGIGMLEAFLTSGGTSTLPSSLGPKLQTLQYKTLRYPGHCEKIKLLFDLGLASETVAPELGVSPREMLEKVLLDNLPKGKPDLVAMRVVVEGAIADSSVNRTWELIDKHDGTFTAMMRTTGFPTAIACKMQLEGDAEPGVMTGDKALDLDLFVKRLRELIPTLSFEEKRR